MILNRPKWGRTVLAGCVVLFLSPAPAKSESAFRFVVWGDATDLLQYAVTSAAQIRQLSVTPRFNLSVGDLYDTGFSLAAVEALRNAMDGDQTNVLSGTMFPVRGNHDLIKTLEASSSLTRRRGWLSRHG
jgi:hypothetical protein